MEYSTQMTYVKIYGYPFHSLEYYIFNEETFMNLYSSHKIEDILNFLDGPFAINIVDDDIEYWITDPCGQFPIFTNGKDIVVNFNDVKEKEYLKIDTDFYNIFSVDDSNIFYNIDIKYKKILETSYNVVYHDDYKFTILIDMYSDLYQNFMYKTPFKKWRICYNNSIYYKQKNDKYYKYIKYNIFNNFHTENEPEKILIDSISKLIKNSNNNIFYLSAGYDSRLLYCILKYLNIKNYKRRTNPPEDKCVDKYIKDTNFSNKKINEIYSNDFINKVLNSDYISMYNGFLSLYEVLESVDDLNSNKYFNINLKGNGGNQYISTKNDLEKNVYANVFYAYNVGHSIKKKYFFNNCFYFNPILNKRFINSIYNNSISSRKDFIISVINKYYPALNNYNYYTEIDFKKNEYNSTCLDKKLYLDNYYKNIL